MSVSGGTTGAMQQLDDRVICQALVVVAVDGIKLAIVGKILPGPQEETLYVRKAVDNDTEPIMRIFMSEEGVDKGILIESSLQYPICLFDTSHARIPPPGRACVSVSRADPVALDPKAAPFAVIERSGQSVVRAYRGTVSGLDDSRELLMTLREDPSGVCASIYDAHEHLVANTEGDSQGGPRPQTLLRIGNGVDSGLVICLVIAAVKLRAC